MKIEDNIIRKIIEIIHIAIHIGELLLKILHWVASNNNDHYIDTRMCTRKSFIKIYKLRWTLLGSQQAISDTINSLVLCW